MQAQAIQYKFYVGRKVFNTWHEAFDFGKRSGDRFSVLYKNETVASWCPREGFYYFCAPEMIDTQPKRAPKVSPKR